MSTIGKLFLITMTTFALAACGFHLRGQGGMTELPFRNVTIVGNSITANTLRDNLSRQPNYTLEPTLSANGLEINLGAPTRDKQVSSINSSGQVTEYRLTLRVPLSVRTQSDILLNSGIVTVSRELSWNESAVLAKEAEEALLWQSMEQDAAPLALYRIGAITRKQLSESSRPAASPASHAR
ncbi:LPS-assembly lipoprotein LptE [Chitinilyticum piscinae]|uniref:LPS-assembly lipoprotein LptE n=1 Tax=Chitinilyticum piscinae TaxID=2866724 RepID=A0A8J7FN71_9NEIS|nr:LPS assembly lipoprotein LptE [Chitinilyticum piscinae]MBE9610560.1 hypothetical protein [Chitinilyticum piscinae]